MLRSTQLMIVIIKTPSSCHAEHSQVHKTIKTPGWEKSYIILNFLLIERLRSARRFHKVAQPDLIEQFLQLAKFLASKFSAPL